MQFFKVIRLVISRWLSYRFLHFLIISEESKYIPKPLYKNGLTMMGDEDAGAGMCSDGGRCRWTSGWGPDIHSGHEAACSENAAWGPASESEPGPHTS